MGCPQETRQLGSLCVFINDSPFGFAGFKLLFCQASNIVHLRAVKYGILKMNSFHVDSTQVGFAKVGSSKGGS